MEERFATAKGRADYGRNTVCPVLEDLACAFYAAQKPPEDVVGFLIDVLTKQHDLPEPVAGPLDEDEEMEVTELEERCKELREQLQVQRTRDRIGSRGGSR
mmetsp:Transcript_68845/g.149845  ORF Transcript_68845/g.149845 Transcript_68845/m.149845 type:complete len:101 (-) Transcript_68845:226-528(-)